MTLIAELLVNAIKSHILGTNALSKVKLVYVFNNAIHNNVILSYYQWT